MLYQRSDPDLDNKKTLSSHDETKRAYFPRYHSNSSEILLNSEDT